MAELKTTRNDASVTAFLDSVENDTRRADGYTVLAMMKEVTGEEPTMWGDSIVGFGQYSYASERSAQKGDWFLTGFSPRKANMTLYLMSGFDELEPLLQKLGKYKLGKGCLYVNKLADVDQNVLRQLVVESYDQMKAAYLGTGPAQGD